MRFGEQWLDPVSLNTYRCDYKSNDWNAELAQFHSGKTKFVNVEVETTAVMI
jgi:hypothetical protein